AEDLEARQRPDGGHLPDRGRHGGLGSRVRPLLHGRGPGGRFRTAIGRRRLRHGVLGDGRLRIDAVGRSLHEALRRGGPTALFLLSSGRSRRKLPTMERLVFGAGRERPVGERPRARNAWLTFLDVLGTLKTAVSPSGSLPWICRKVVLIARLLSEVK